MRGRQQTRRFGRCLVTSPVYVDHNRDVASSPEHRHKEKVGGRATPIPGRAAGEAVQDMDVERIVYHLRQFEIGFVGHHVPQPGDNKKPGS